MAKKLTEKLLKKYAAGGTSDKPKPPIKLPGIQTMPASSTSVAPVTRNVLMDELVAAKTPEAKKVAEGKLAKKRVAKNPESWTPEDWKNYRIAEPGIQYVPIEAAVLPGTPMIKGLGKVGNFVLDAANPIGGMRDISKTPLKSNFKSEINWSKWNKEIPDNHQLIKEYNAIEQASKANGTWMKNPDGSPFQGTPEQFVQQNSENFKKAFGNSKLINPDGSPTIQYHGSAKKFDTFDESKFQLGDSGYSGRGIYTTPDKNKASSYSLSSKSIHKDGNYEPTVYELYGQGNNPISAEDLINQKKEYDLFNFYRQKDWRGNVPLEEQMLDYDVAIRNQTRGIERVSPWNQADELVFPTNRQLKSAIGNNGMFDMTNPNIYKSIVGAIGAGAVLQNNTTDNMRNNPKKALGGKTPVKPIIVTNPNDPRLKAYNDSNELYNKSRVSVRKLIDRGYTPSTRFHDGENWDQNPNLLPSRGIKPLSNLFYDLTAENYIKYKSKGELNPTDREVYGGFKGDLGEDEKGKMSGLQKVGVGKFPKPVQPVVYQKPKPTATNQSKPKVSEDSLYNNFKNTLPSNLKNTSENDYNLRGYWESLGKPDKFDYTQPKEKDGYYHAFSRNPQTGEILKKPNHPTFQMALEEDAKIGYNAYQSPDGKIHTFGKNDTIPKGFTKYTTTKPTQQPTKPLPFKAKYNMPDTSATPNMQGEYPLRTFYQGTNTQREADSIEDVKGLERIKLQEYMRNNPKKKLKNGGLVKYFNGGQPSSQQPVDMGLTDDSQSSQQMLPPVDPMSAIMFVGNTVQQYEQNKQRHKQYKKEVEAFKQLQYTDPNSYYEQALNRAENADLSDPYGMILKADKKNLEFGRDLGYAKDYNALGFAPYETSTQKSLFKLGGYYNVGGMDEDYATAEVEGNEHAVDPNGTGIQFEGPNHENGGIPVDLEPGTKVFSKRLKDTNGKSFAQNADRLSKKLTKATKKLDEYPNSSAIENSIAILETQRDEVFNRQEDMKVTKQAKKIMKNGGLVKYALGGPFEDEFSQEELPRGLGAINPKTGIPYTREEVEAAYGVVPQSNAPLQVTPKRPTGFNFLPTGEPTPTVIQPNQVPSSRAASTFNYLTDETPAGATPAQSAKFMAGETPKGYKVDLNTALPYAGSLANILMKNPKVPTYSKMPRTTIDRSGLNLMPSKFDINPQLEKSQADVRALEESVNKNISSGSGRFAASLAAKVANMRNRNELYGQKFNVENQYKGDKARLLTQLNSQQAGMDMNVNQVNTGLVNEQLENEYNRKVGNLGLTRQGLVGAAEVKQKQDYDTKLTTADKMKYQILLRAYQQSGVGSRFEDWLESVDPNFAATLKTK